MRVAMVRVGEYRHLHEFGGGALVASAEEFERPRNDALDASAEGHDLEGKVALARRKDV